jgi:hypothetical protein
MMSPVKKSFLTENHFYLKELKLEMLLKLYKTLVQLETRAEDVSVKRWDYGKDIKDIETEILSRQPKKRKK